MKLPHFRHEMEILAEGFTVCGIDEAGRGPWAGPVVAAAVILDPDNIPSGLNDSKKLTAAKREVLFPAIMQSAQVGVGKSSPEEIDEINILQATYLAMSRAVAALDPQPAFALIDGNRAPPLSIRMQTIVAGDAISLSVAAASIVAKVTRDRIMHEIEALHPGYGFASHKGYGTPAHAAALQRLGPCPVHRKSFSPVFALIDLRVR
jgi:ribonuclease HII